MVPLTKRCPELAASELFALDISNAACGLPNGRYLFLESYCASHECDCRRVFLNVLHADQIIATIGFGWEPIGFYYDWMGKKPDESKLMDETIRDTKGPVLEFGGYSGPHAEKMLEYFKTRLMSDSTLIGMLKRHYDAFKRATVVEAGYPAVDFQKLSAARSFGGKENLRGGSRTGLKLAKTGRNEPCPCGSGKKYKRCCMDKG